MDDQTPPNIGPSEAVEALESNAAIPGNRFGKAWRNKRIQQRNLASLLVSMEKEKDTGFLQKESGGGFNVDSKLVFLEFLRNTRSVSRACTAANVSRSAVYDHLAVDEKFRKAYIDVESFGEKASIVDFLKEAREKSRSGRIAADGAASDHRSHLHRLLAKAGTTDVVELQERLKTDLRFLYKEVCGYDLWDEKLHGDYPGDPEKGIPCGLWYFLEHSGLEKLILMPRGHLKSTEVTVVWVIQQILRDPNIRVCINNAIFGTAASFVATIAAHLDNDKPLAEVFGTFHGPRSVWNQDQITISQRTLPRAQPTVMAASVETTLNGKHFDLILNDDLVEPNNVRTKEQIEKVIAFQQDCYNQLDPGGTIVVIGTRWANQDLYGEILNTQLKSVNLAQVPQDKMHEWNKYAPQP